MSPLKASHPFFGRQKLGGSKASAVDETLHNFETASLQPCPPLHVTQNEEVMQSSYSLFLSSSRVKVTLTSN